MGLAMSESEISDYIDIEVCDECVLAIVNGDLTGLDYSYDSREASERKSAIVAGEESLSSEGQVVISGDRNEFSIDPCDCCGTKLAGGRTSGKVLITKVLDAADKGSAPRTPPAHISR